MEVGKYNRPHGRYKKITRIFSCFLFPLFRKQQLISWRVQYPTCNCRKMIIFVNTGTSA